MKQLIIILLLFTSITQGQTTLANKLKILANETSTTATKVNVQESNGLVNTIAKADLIEVLEYSTASAMPVTGVSGKIYVTIDSGRLYRWNGTVYNELAVTDISGKENISNKQNSLTVDGTGVNYPTVDAVNSGLALKRDIINYNFASDIIVNSVNIGRGTGNNINNNAFGANALIYNTTGVGDSAFSVDALRYNTTGNNNTAIGAGSMFSNISGGFNSALGYQSLYFNNGNNNIAVGQQSLYNNTTGSNNAAVGYEASRNNTTASSNSSWGSQSMFSTTTGSSNTASGSGSLFANTVGVENAVYGSNSLRNNVLGSLNSALGTRSGQFIADKTSFATRLDNSIMIGYRSSPLADNQTNQTVIGYDAIGLGSNTTVVGNSSTTSARLWGRFLSGTSVDNGIDQIQVPNGTISAQPATLSNQVVVKSQLDLKANIASPTFTEIPRVPTATAGTNTTQIASTAFVNDAVSLKRNITNYTFASDLYVNGITVGRGGGNLDGNSANGYQSLFNNTYGYNNTANGNQALFSNLDGGQNTANGGYTLYSNTTGYNNMAIGLSALFNNTTGYSNTGSGANALYSNTTGNNNTTNGSDALYSNTTGNNNTANGVNALYSNTIGGNNTANGFQAGRFITNGTTANTITNNSVFLGHNTKALADNQTNQTVIGSDAIGNGSNTATIGNDLVTGTFLKGRVTVNNVIRLKNYIVATLPAGTQGDSAYVTDAMAPTYLAAIVGGGSIVTPVFYNGTTWVSH